MTNTQQAKILTPEKLYTLRYPLPQSWTNVIGILKGRKRIDPLKYQKQIRKEWEKRNKQLERLLVK